MKTRFHTAQRRLRIQASLAFVAFLVAVFALPANRQAIAQGYGVTLASLNTRLNAVEAKTQFVSVAAGEMYVKGTNLHIENGLPNPGLHYGVPIAPTLNGKGNLIVGYNMPHSSDVDPNFRTGSHNLILGDQNNYTSYDGVVCGQNSSILAPYASVISGYQNTASGYGSSVTAGYQNTASGDYSCASGGGGNISNGYISSVVGGIGNQASGHAASAIGGAYDTASSDISFVSGGVRNNANGYISSISGGYGNTASGQYASVSGGGGNTASGNMASVSGGYGNTASGQGASVSGGGNGKTGLGVTESNDNGWAAGGIGAGTYHSP